MELRRLRIWLPAVALAVAPFVFGAPGPAAASSAPDLGANVHIFTPAMTQAGIQAELNTIAVAQAHNQFGSRRDAVLFAPGTYGSAAHPLVFQLGYYTTVAGLGLSPDDVHIVGAIEVPNQCNNNALNQCFALVNFWRSVSNLTIDVHTAGADLLPAAATAPESPGCVGSNELFAVSQAAPLRRVNINGLVFLFDYCGGPQFASGGFIADSKTGFVINATQQQWITRNSSIGGWSNAVWNQVFSGVVGAPAQAFPNPPFTTLATSPVTREAPFLYLDGNGSYNVFVPSLQHDTSGPSWASGPTPGSSLPISSFYVASPSDSGAKINSEIHRGLNLLLTPGVYRLEEPIEVTQPDTVVLGLGMATLVPQNGAPAMNIHPHNGVIVEGIIFDAGPELSPVLLEVGSGREASDATDPSGLYDVFFRVGGPAAGRVQTALIVNSDNAILDDLWVWRADHGNGVGWTSNTADTGVVVNGDNVTAYGLFVEHFQKYEVIWNGNNGTDVFFQNEMPYDVPSQDAWREAPGVDGFAAFKVADTVTSFTGFGMGSYSFFNQGLDIFAERGFEVPATLPPGSLHDLFTIFLDKVHGKGGIRHVVNETGGSSTILNPDAVVPVVSFP
ncbi:MAG TPA: adenylyl cyclase [Candidatus Dormibacteraeota bacterium]|nr:adenylyl cyclase [Candidatus Dormibacteraeota bacterium]